MKNKVSPCECGCTEFVTQPNRYDIYEIVDDGLLIKESAFIDDEQILYCRECGEELETYNTLTQQ